MTGLVEVQEARAAADSVAVARPLLSRDANREARAWIFHFRKWFAYAGCGEIAIEDEIDTTGTLD